MINYKQRKTIMELSAQDPFDAGRVELFPQNIKDVFLVGHRPQPKSVEEKKEVIKRSRNIHADMIQAKMKTLQMFAGQRSLNHGIKKFKETK